MSCLSSLSRVVQDAQEAAPKPSSRFLQPNTTFNLHPIQSRLWPSERIGIRQLAPYLYNSSRHHGWDFLAVASLKRHQQMQWQDGGRDTDLSDEENDAIWSDMLGNVDAPVRGVRSAGAWGSAYRASPAPRPAMRECCGLVVTKT